MITDKIETMAEAEDSSELHSKREAITALFPYAVWRDRDGEPRIFDKFLLAARAWGEFGNWPYTHLFYRRLFYEASPRTIVLVSPYLRSYTHVQERTRQWDAAVSLVPYTEEVAHSVVDMLLQIAAYPGLGEEVTNGAWLWLTKLPSLSPVSRGRANGSNDTAVRTIRELNDPLILKSYLLLLWSECDALNYYGFDEMCASIHDFSGIEMGHHRADLIKRLDYILGQLDQGLEYLQRDNPRLEEYHMPLMRDRYGELKGILMETNVEAIARTSYPMVTLPRVLTQVDTCRISCNIYVCASSPMSIVLRLEPSASPSHFIVIIPTFIRRSEGNINCPTPKRTARTTIQHDS